MEQIAETPVVLLSGPINAADVNKAQRSESKLRWLVLLLSCAAAFGNYYCFDNPTALSEPLKEQLKLSSLEYNLLYSLYSFPNMILPLFGGVFIDRIGVNTSLILFTGFLCCGQALFAFGVTQKNFIITVAGRFVFGFGGECQGVAVATIIAVWFRNKEMAFAMGTIISVSRLGSVANDSLSPWFKSQVSLGFACFAGAILLGGCILLCLLLAYIERSFVRTRKKRGLEVESIVTGEEVAFADIIHFDRIFWFLASSCFIVYGCVFPFNNIAGSFFQDRFGFSEKHANLLLMIPFTISAVVSPFLGGLIDQIGKRDLFIFSSPSLMALAHGFLGLTKLYPEVWMVCIGIAFAFYAAALAPSFALVVNENQMGTAFGVLFSIQNIGLTMFPIVVGELKDATGNYRDVELFFVALCLGGCVNAMFLMREDARTGLRLHSVALKANAMAGDDDDAKPFSSNVQSDSGGNDYHRLPEDKA